MQIYGILFAMYEMNDRTLFQAKAERNKAIGDVLRSLHSLFNESRSVPLFALNIFTMFLTTKHLMDKFNEVANVKKLAEAQSVYKPHFAPA